MSTLTSPTSGGLFTHPRRARRGPQWRRAAAWTLGVNLYLAAWFWLIAVVVVTLAIVVVDRVGTVTLSIMQFAEQGATWFPFATALLLVTTQIGVHVASGMTRRSFVRAQLVTVSVSATVHALLMSTAITLEGVVYDHLGWPHVTGDGGRALWQDGFAPALLEYLPLFLGAQVSGLLVGITYYRYGGWRGTFLLPLTVAPVILPNLAGRVLARTWDTAVLDVPALLVLAAGIGLVALAAYAFARLTRTVPIRRVTA